jgi:IS605 OrfB family transposase
MLVTRIAYPKAITSAKLSQLSEIARRLGNLRTEVWDKFGSLQGVKTTHRSVRDSWLAQKRKFDIPARLWKETLRDVFADIEAYRAAAAEKVKRGIFRHTKDKPKQQELFKALKDGSWLNDRYLRSRMRKYFKHGHTQVNNQIVLDTNCYTWFSFGGQGWIEVMSLIPRKRIAIPLDTKNPVRGTIRLIIRDGSVEVHHTVNPLYHCQNTACGQAEIGIDKGYTEAFIDSDGQQHGEGLGELLSGESDALKVKYQRRNKLRAIAQKKRHKRHRINKHNLGRKKLHCRQIKHHQKVKTKIYTAVHSIVDKAKLIGSEDLTSVIKSDRGKDNNRRLSGWVKGMMADALAQVSLRRGASLVLVNAAYTSQACSQCDCLGNRCGDTFYCTNPGCGVVLQADQNAAANVKHRIHDKEICRWTPYKVVKSILLERQAKRFRLSNQDSRCCEGRLDMSVKTSDPSESEMTQCYTLLYF